MDDAKILQEIQKPGRAGFDRFDLAASINEEIVPLAVPLDLAAAQDCLKGRGKWARIELIAAGRIAATEQEQVLCLAFVQDPSAVSLDDLVTAGLLANADRLALIATRARRRWELVGSRPLDHGDIIRARGERWEDYSIPNPAGDAWKPVAGSQLTSDPADPKKP